MIDSRPSAAAASKSQALRSFWILGLLNNAPWVLMLAVATDISAGGVALVFLANQIPGLVVKATAPYWFHRASYRARLRLASATTAAACFLVGCGGWVRAAAPDGAGRGGAGLALELLGVSLVSFSCNLGEASLLALAGKFDSVILPAIDNDIALQSTGASLFAEEDEPGDARDDPPAEERDGPVPARAAAPRRRALTAFASGTGLAGIAGYGYKALLFDYGGWGLSATVWSAALGAVAYWRAYDRGLCAVEDGVRDRGAARGRGAEERGGPGPSPADDAGYVDLRLQGRSADGVDVTSALVPAPFDARPPHCPPERPEPAVTPQQLTACEKFGVVLSLWPYTVPLFTVYAAEYMLQAGVWSAMGFPVTSARARARFYQYSNWTYQAGVFVSRSSGNLCAISLPVLWLLPLLQVANLGFFWLTALQHFWYDYGLLLPCFGAGLLGGAVYVQGFARVNADMPPELREFAIASVSVADSLGILFADVAALFLQSCIYKENNLAGAVVECPY